MSGKRIILTILSFFFVTLQLHPQKMSESFYPPYLFDSLAVYLTPDKFDVTPDAEGDDTKALQEAIDEVERKSKYGIVFIPEGEYEISSTVYIWKGIRVIGIGKRKPIFVLKENTPGFSNLKHKYLFHFASNKPLEGEQIIDANPGTFYSALSNVAIVIKDGNSSAVAVRSHFAQHSFISHVDFYVGNALAGIEEIGNEIEDCSFVDGKYGIIATKTSPSWPFLIIDCTFENQKNAAIKTEEAGLTIVNSVFKNLYNAITVNPDRSEKLFITHSYFENIRATLLTLSEEYNSTAQYNLKDVLCINVDTIAFFRKSGKTIKVPDKKFRIINFIHGLQIDSLSARSEIKTLFEYDNENEPLINYTKEIPPLPKEKDWVNIKRLGAKGNGIDDDTEIIKEAISKYDVIYFPSGRYKVKETIQLKNNTVLIGLNPITTQIVLEEKSPEFNREGSPIALVETSKGGNNIVTGLGIDPGLYNNRAVAVKWMAGSKSLMNDVRLLGGHGTYTVSGKYVPIYNEYRTGDPLKDWDWDKQYWSLWITNGGGGIFKDIWTPNTYATAGVYISETSTPGKIYAMSVEHHVRNEVIFKNVSNWEIYALQMEEESAESPEALPLKIENSSNLLFANLYLYRVIRIKTPYPYGILVNKSKNIDFRGIHVYSPTVFSYDNTLYDVNKKIYVREREIARLLIKGTESPDKKCNLVKLTGGFEFIAGATLDEKGNLYFTDSRFKRIYKWSANDSTLSTVKDLTFEPLALAFDKSGNLIITSTSGGVYSTNLDRTDENLLPLKTIKPGIIQPQYAAHPSHLWRDEHDFLTITTDSIACNPYSHSSYTIYFRNNNNPFEEYFISIDSTLIIPKYNDLNRAVALRLAFPGKEFYMADEFGQKTWKFKVRNNGMLTDPELFAEQGELDVAVDSQGNVYIPAGDVYVYDKTGKLLKRIKVPERPTNVVVDNKKNQLYIVARSSIYSYKISE
ncbi:glycosyl hydrolase family 28-related protein [Melioribacter sp. OK-6-Me]|uniref:glycosyl hydrolase family 28-related protein n=1 Tax=unclassified Melioribacter TaxID=2627329 RepID=UPI003ED9879E